jgi:hypothetical protein
MDFQPLSDAALFPVTLTSDDGTPMSIQGADIKLNISTDRTKVMNGEFLKNRFLLIEKALSQAPGLVEYGSMPKILQTLLIMQLKDSPLVLEPKLAALGFYLKAWNSSTPTFSGFPTKQHGVNELGGTYRIEAEEMVRYTVIRKNLPKPYASPPADFDAKAGDTYNKGKGKGKSPIYEFAEGFLPPDGGYPSTKGPIATMNEGPWGVIFPEEVYLEQMELYEHQKQIFDKDPSNFTGFTAAPVLKATITPADGEGPLEYKYFMWCGAVKNYFLRMGRTPNRPELSTTYEKMSTAVGVITVTQTDGPGLMTGLLYDGSSARRPASLSATG